MSLLKVNSSVDLEQRVEILEKKVKEILKHLGKSTPSDPKKDAEKNDDEYCCIS